MSKITDTTALNVLCRTSARGTDASDFFHSKIYDPQAAINNLERKGYQIQIRKVTNNFHKNELCWFINLKAIQDHAISKKRAVLEAAQAQR